MTDNVRHITEIPRSAGGQFARGNPGRPKGAKGRKGREVLEQIKALTPEALTALKAALDANERWAVELVLSKVIPTAGRLMEYHDTTSDDVHEALRTGEISATEAKDLSAAIAKLSEIEGVEQLKERLAEIESQLNGSARK